MSEWKKSIGSMKLCLKNVYAGLMNRISEKKMSLKTHNIPFSMWFEFMKTNYFVSRKLSQPRLSLKVRFQKYVSGIISSILSDPEVSREAQNLMRRVLLEPKSIETGAILCTDILKHPAMAQELNSVGLHLVISILKSPEFQKRLEINLLEAVQTESIKTESVRLLKYVATQEKSRDAIATLFKDVFVREDIIESVNKILATSAYQVCSLKETERILINCLAKVLSDSDLQNHIFHSILEPLTSSFSLG